MLHYLVAQRVWHYLSRVFLIVEMVQIQNGHERKGEDLLRALTRISIEIADQVMSLHAGFQCFAIPNTRLIW